ncbi:Inner membrane protein YohK [Marinobacterium sp. xm-a-121]|uniref:LrgB family protein n=1 Tax=unclassified Marinobacterium TaxID=2644139 RepID=UPI00156A4479|nr:Inner membrane protein YohK [Marinobacterium sp. xm-d-579]NRP38270.1 Inner membrane protein YohK [Marinobacterium sp. xm-a-121]NRP98714.1 Inner membrane protein YohK [Marinobacterium sp. xm-v-233]
MIIGTDFWVYFAARPLIWIVLTLAVFTLANLLYQRADRSPILHPVLISMVVLILMLLVTGTPYETYFSGAQFIHFLLGPATVALAVPMFQYFDEIRRLWLPILVSSAVGALVASLSAVGVTWLFDARFETMMSVAPKSVTSPIALGIAEKIGGLPSLAAALVLVTGVMGSILVPIILKRMRVEDQSVRGFVLGLTSHGFGTAVALEVGAVAGAFAGLAMGLTGLLTAFLLPIVIG